MEMSRRKYQFSCDHKSSILSSTSLQMVKTFWGVVSAAVEQFRRKANMVARGDGEFGPRGRTRNPSKQQQKKKLAITSRVSLNKWKKTNSWQHFRYNKQWSHCDRQYIFRSPWISGLIKKNTEGNLDRPFRYFKASKDQLNFCCSELSIDGF